MTFPLFQRPGTIVFLDDDPDYLEMLALVLPRNWHVKLFLRPSECIKYLKEEPARWEADAWRQQQLVGQWRDGKPLIPQILDYWSKSPDRYALTRVCVIDFSMPSMDGLQVLSELGDWPGSRVLLTGQADEQVAVKAFNRGLIEQFIPKQSTEITRRLVGAVERLTSSSNPRHAQTWRATLSAQQDALVREPPAAQALSALCAAKRWVEYVVIGAPFGILGMDAAGQVWWLQLESREGLGALAEVAELAGVAPEGLAQLRTGQKLADLELRQSLGLTGACELVPAFSVTDKLLGAVFALQPAAGPGPAQSYSQWLARQGRRELHH